MIQEGSRGQGFTGSSEMLKNYKELNVLEKSYESYGSVCELGTAKKDIAEIERMLKALIKSLENKQLVEDPVDFHGESLTLGILGPSSPTKLEKNLKF